MTSRDRGNRDGWHADGGTLALLSKFLNAFSLGVGILVSLANESRCKKNRIGSRFSCD